MIEHETKHFRFGEFSLDVGERKLAGLGEAALLRPKVFETLHYLLTHADRIVSKEELLEAVWSDLNVADASLVRTVHELRSLLHDPPDTPRYIRTIPCVGYALIAPVEAVTSTRPGGVLGRVSVMANRRRPMLTAIGIIAVALICSLTFWALRPLWGDDGIFRTEPSHRALVFLPVMIPAGDPQLGGFAREFSEFLIAELDANLQTKLILPSREQAADEMDALMVELGEALHLECTVMLDGDGVTTVCKLIDPVLREVLLARSHEASLDDPSQPRAIAVAIGSELEEYFPRRR